MSEVAEKLKEQIDATRQLRGLYTTGRVHLGELACAGNQIVIMEAQLAILDRVDDKKAQIIAALDAKYPHLFTEEQLATRDEGSIENIVLFYMAEWGDVAGRDAVVNHARELHLTAEQMDDVLLSPQPLTDEIGGSDD